MKLVSDKSEMAEPCDSHNNMRYGTLVDRVALLGKLRIRNQDMPRFFLHFIGGVDCVEDRDGGDYASQAEAKAAAIKCLRDIAANDAHEGVIDARNHIDIQDDKGETLCTVTFAEAIDLRVAQS